MKLLRFKGRTYHLFASLSFCYPQASFLFVVGIDINTGKPHKYWLDTEWRSKILLQLKYG